MKKYLFKSSIEFISEDLRKTISELVDDDYVEEWVNEIQPDAILLFNLGKYGIGTIIRDLAESCRKRDYEKLWNDLVDDCVDCICESILEDLDWNGIATFLCFTIQEVDS